MTGFAEVAVGPLLLRAVVAEDLPEPYEIHSDPAVWQRHPPGRHTDTSRTVALIEQAEQGWHRYGLDYWSIRAVDDPGRLLGIGGASRREPAALGVPVWNVYYRLAPHAWGHGYASTVAGVAISAAHQVDAQLPVVANMVEHNSASRRVAERAGLTVCKTDHEPGNGAVRYWYADRELPAP